MSRIDRRSPFHAKPVHLAGELVAEFLEQRRIHQVMAQRVQDPCFEPVAADVLAVVARALVAGGRAADQIGFTCCFPSGAEIRSMVGVN